jgi:hypothetical protein
MFLGKFLIMGGAPSATYTAPFRRRGLAALFTAEVTQVAGSLTLTLRVDHKNSDESTWAAAGTFSSISAEGVYTQDITGIKEQVRIAATLSGGSQGDFVELIFRSEGISWRP